MLSRNLKKWGFKSCDASVEDAMNASLKNFAKNKCSSRVKKGGRIVLPSEYFGVNSGRYAADANPGSSLEVTQEFIRGPLAISDPTGALAGGAAARTFAVTKKAVKEACAGAACDHGAIKSAYESKMTELMNTLEKRVKNEHLCEEDFEKVFNMKKYAVLRAA